MDQNNFTDPIVPALEVPEATDLSDAEVPMKHVDASDLPQCPKCKESLLRPGVVWFGESLPHKTLTKVDKWMSDDRGIDLIMVIGTSASVYPAAGYIMSARAQGAKVAVINIESPDAVASRLQEGDWFFRGDAGVVVPQILESVIGPIAEA